MKLNLKILVELLVSNVSGCDSRNANSLVITGCVAGSGLTDQLLTK